MLSAYEIVDGVPTYNLFVGGTWTRALRNAVTDDINPATGTLYARVQQASAAETTAAIDAAAVARSIGKINWFQSGKPSSTERSTYSRPKPARLSMSWSRKQGRSSARHTSRLPIALTFCARRPASCGGPAVRR